jgi:hypothetical protein
MTVIRGIVVLCALCLVLAASSATPRPSLPTLELVSADGAHVTVSWPKDDEASAYRLYADGERVGALRGVGRTRARFRDDARTYMVELLTRTGRPIAVYSLEYRSALTLIEEAGSVTGRQLVRSMDDAEQGLPVIVRPRDGQDLVVEGDIVVNRPRVTIENVVVRGVVAFDPPADHGVLRSSSALGFDIFGADNVLIEGNRFDGQGRRNQNIIWDKPSGDTPDNWVIRGNDFRNFYEGDLHSEALFIGYSKNGLIEGNSFTNNGNTSHIFFSYCGTQSSELDECKTYPGTYPRNICARNNVFNRTHDAFYDFNFRPEIPFAIANIVTQPGASSTEPQLIGTC